MKTIRVLILEDDLETLSRLLECAHLLEEEIIGDIAITVLAEYTQVQNYLNNARENIFDIILLDRDCKAGGSFHILDFSKYPIERIIGISSTPPYNEQLKEKGVMRIVHKDYQDLDKFIGEVKSNIKDLLQIS